MLVELVGITKVFPPDVVALDNVTLDLQPGEIHALVGENGAGKSTLMKVLNGELHAERGEIRIDGRSVRFSGPAEASAAGIGMVHQEILLVPGLRVWENVVLGTEPRRGGWRKWVGALDVAAARAAVRATVDDYELGLDVDARVDELSVAARQKVEIAKVLHRRGQVIVLDEPTAVLTPQESEQLFVELGALKASGRTIVFISHRLDEVLRIADRVSVLRDGALIDTLPVPGLTKAALARLMVERDVVLRSVPRTTSPGDVVTSLRQVRVTSPSGQPIGPIDLDIRAGEIVGVAGVEGSGQSELVAAVSGLAPVDGGVIEIAGRDVTESDVMARRAVLGHVPAERKTTGGAVGATIAENTLMTHHRRNAEFTRGGVVIDDAHARGFAARLGERYAVAMRGVGQLFGTLSGGNQQKVILGRELSHGAPFLLLDQPTRGLDVGSIEYVHGQIRSQRDEGVAVLLVSADLEELFLLADRIAVLHRGALVATLDIAATTPIEVGALMLTGAAAVGSAT